MPPEAAPVAPLSRNAEPIDQRSRRIRVFAGSVTTPLGRPTTTVSPSPLPSAPWENVACPAVALSVEVDESHGSTDFTGPAKHVTREMAPGALTVAVVEPIGTDQPLPVMLRYSSSWSANPLRTPSRRYRIV